MVEVSLLVPVKDEVASLAQLVDEVTAAMDSGADGAGHGWELIFIDDGSTDGTWKEIVRLSGRDPGSAGCAFVATSASRPRCRPGSPRRPAPSS